MSNFKKMVQARMAKTGEGWQTAARYVRSQARSIATSTGEILTIDSASSAITPTAARTKRYDPSKPTVYPDHSTLSAAFKAHRNQPDAANYAAYLPLRDWFEHVAHDANLCLSTTHIVELVGWKDYGTADSMASWYDAMPVVWAKSIYDDMEEWESERWTKIAAKVEIERNTKPFAPTLLTAFRSLSLDAAVALLAEREPALAMLKAMRGSPAWRQRWQSYCEGFIGMVMDVVMNHQYFTNLGWTDERKRQETAVNIRRSLWQRAEAADRRLTARGDAAYAQKQCTLAEVRARLIELYEVEPKAMPLMRVIQRFNEGAIAHAERGEVVNGQPSKRLRETLESAFGDWMHIVGAAYCDIFTCDGIVADWLGDGREALGLRRQLSARGYAGGPVAFVRDLMATVP